MLLNLFYLGNEKTYDRFTNSGHAHLGHLHLYLDLILMTALEI